MLEHGEIQDKDLVHSTDAQQSNMPSPPTTIDYIEEPRNTDAEQNMSPLSQNDRSEGMNEAQRCEHMYLTNNIKLLSQPQLFTVNAVKVTSDVAQPPVFAVQSTVIASATPTTQTATIVSAGQKVLPLHDEAHPSHNKSPQLVPRTDSTRPVSTSAIH